MTTKTSEAKRMIPWRKRAGFKVGRNRKARQRQYNQQTQMLTLVLVVALVGVGLVILINYNGAGSTKEVSCEEFPEYCVPLAGTSPGYASLEAADTRELDQVSQGAEGVVRYVDPEFNIPVLGDPNAPIQFAVVSDFSCSHCQDYHRGELKDIFQDFVLTGQATFAHVMTTGTGGQYSQTASMAALCAGEQGAFWEMADELFRLGNSAGPANAFTASEIHDSADDMGLDADELISCVNSSKYRSVLAGYQTFAQDAGVTATPTVVYRVGDSGPWTRAPNRGYAAIQALVEAANRGS